MPSHPRLSGGYPAGSEARSTVWAWHGAGMARDYSAETAAEILFTVSACSPDVTNLSLSHEHVNHDKDLSYFAYILVQVEVVTEQFN